MARSNNRLSIFRRFSLLVAICGLLTAGFAAPQQHPALGKAVRSVTLSHNTTFEFAENFATPVPSDLPISAVGSLLWGASDPTGLMDNVAISANGSLAAIGVSLNNYSLRVFNAVSGDMVYEVPGEDGLSDAAVTPNGDFVAWGQSHVLRVFPGDIPSEVWSRTIPAEHYFGGIALSADGEYLLALESRGTDSLYATLTPTLSQTPVWEIALPMMAANNHWIGARFSADGSKIVATSRFRLFVLDAATGDLIWNEDGRNTEHPASISADGHVITSGSNNDSKLHVFAWDSANSTYMQLWDYRFSGGTSNWGTATAVSANGETVAGGSLQFTSAGGFEGYVAVFETYGGGVPLWTPVGMGDLVGDVEISDDGLTIAACSWGYLNDSQPDIRVFEKYDPTPFYTYTHPGSPNDLELSADGTRLIAGGKAVHNRVFGNGGNAYVFALDLEGGDVSGTVTLGGTTDFSGVVVEAVGSHMRATTDTQGNYRIRHIPAGSYTISARKLGYTWGSTAGIVVTEDGLTSGVDFALAQTAEPPQNLSALSGQISSIDLSWSPASLSARRARARDALDAAGDTPLNPFAGDDLFWTADNPWRTSFTTARNERDPLDDPDSIHVWRSTLAGGPYALIGSLDGSLTTYSDSVGVTPTRTYYYVVTGVYSNGETAYSNEAVGALDDSYLVYDPVVPPLTTPVSFDGVLAPGEWTDAIRIDISDVFGYDGPNPPGGAYLYMKYDDLTDELLLGCEDHLNSSLDDGEGFGIYVDDDDSDTWSYNRPGSEGNYWAYYYSTGATLRYRSLSGAPYNADPYYTFPSPQIAFSTASGYFTGEVAIPLGFQEQYQVALYGPDKTPGIGFFVIQRQAGVAIFDGWWPQNIPSIVSNPEYFSNSSVQATLNVPPAAPPDVAVVRNGTSLQIAWSDPVVGVDDLPLNNLAGLKLYRNGEFLDYVADGVESYTDADVIYGAWYDYSVSGFVLEGDVEYEGPLSVAVGEYAGAAPEIEYLVYDDGTLNFYMIVSGVYDQNRFAVRADMPATHEFVYTIQLMVNAIVPIGIGVAEDQGGLPGTQLFGPYFVTPPVAGEFFTVHIPGEGPPAIQGSFWATIDWLPTRPAEPGIATDSDADQGRSFWYQGATGWRNQPSNFMIRSGVGDFVSDADDPLPGTVHEYSLQANYPNPFNPETMIPFSLARSEDATLAIYNIAGQRVATLVSGNQPAGHHIVRWNGTSDAGTTLTSGVYFARLQAGSFTQTRKLMLLR